jgi:hypothetical protein
MSTQPVTSEYMLLFRGTHWDKSLSPQEIQTVRNQWNACFDQLTQQGKIKSAHPLEHEGKIVAGKKAGVWPMVPSPNPRRPSEDIFCCKWRVSMKRWELLKSVRLWITG